LVVAVNTLIENILGNQRELSIWTTDMKSVVEINTII
jgi:hypothetical protein